MKMSAFFSAFAFATCSANAKLAAVDAWWSECHSKWNSSSNLDQTNERQPLKRERDGDGVRETEETDSDGYMRLRVGKRRAQRRN